jgi:hypothetical protein
MREELAMNKVRSIAELYALADKCVRAEEGRKLPGKAVGAGGESEEDDATPPTKNWRWNKKRKGKTVLAVEESSNPGAAKKAKVDNPGKELAGCVSCQALAAADRSENSASSIARSIAPRATISRIAGKLNNLSRSKELSMKSETRRRPKTVLRDPARSAGAEGVAAARPSNKKKGPLEAATKKEMMLTMERMMSLVSKNFREPQRLCVLTGVLRCILPTVDLNSGCEKLMQRSHRSMHVGP